MDNTALIGGIVGSIAALLLAGGLIAFIVTRRQRRAKSDQNDARTMQLDRQSKSNASSDGRGEYGVLSTVPSTYDQIEVMPKEENYTKGALEL